MANTYTYTISDLKRDITDGYVSKVDYVTTTTDDKGLQVTTNVWVDLPKPSSLVPYADLTESQVVTWVKDKLGTSGLASEHSAGDTALASRIASTGHDAYGIPWS